MFSLPKRKGAVPKERKVVPEEVWRFPKIGSKKQRQLYVPESMQHPAKMDVALTRKLIKEFVPKDATILDPMAGIGTTGVEGILLGRNVILVDIEKKFTELEHKNIENVKKINKKSHFKLPLGQATIITGDSRNLKQLLQEHTDAILTSPPFAEQNRGGGIAKKGYKGKHGEDPKLHLRHDRALSENPDNISNLQFQEDVHAIITSPPFKTATQGGGLNKKPPKTFRGVLKKHSFKLSDNPGNLDNLPLGKIGSVITSPPYPEAYKASPKPRGEQAKRLPKKILVKNPKGGGALSLFLSNRNIAAKGFLEGMPPNPDNIGNLSYPSKQVDAVIVSPPFGDVQKRDRSKEKRWNEDREKKRSGGCITQSKGLQPESPNNIGGLQVKGGVDAVITSPPYSNIHQCPANSAPMTEFFMQQLKEKGFIEWRGKRYTESEWRAMNHGRIDGRSTKGVKKDATYSDDPQNIGNLPHGKVDIIITSPPYSEGIGHSLGANIGKTIPEPIRRTRSFQSKVALGLKHELIKHASEGNIGSITDHGDVQQALGEEKTRQKKK